MEAVVNGIRNHPQNPRLKTTSDAILHESAGERGPAAGLCSCDSLPGGLAVTTSGQRHQDLILLTSSDGQASHSRGQNQAVGRKLPLRSRLAWQRACVQEEGRPGAYCHLARGLLRTFEVIRVFSGCDSFLKFVFSTI